MGSFLNAERYRYAAFAGLFAVGCGAAYLIDREHERPSGDTMLGYALGGAAAAITLFLMGYGMKRRLFAARGGNTLAWLSMHVYWGACLLVVASLHCAFEFGFNVHTLCYALLCLVVASGCWGVYAYLRYPKLMIRDRGAHGREELRRRLEEMDRQARTIAAGCAPQVRDLVADSIRRTHLGGGAWTQLKGTDGSMLEIVPVRGFGFARIVANPAQKAAIAELAVHQAAAQRREPREALHRLLLIFGERAALARRIRRDIQLQGLLQAWLYVHVPLCFALLAALALHVFSVFYYR